ncbi:hypothetical protein V6N12_041998 [Hibiscus sabdariffa]|uniref:Reverse transcriptase zinc-binding domain-containing protein n=1 Tax=Hibiscus sabdariffa TaxID=183260 RepID=A0ABR2EDH4_9ROSI
MDTDGCWKWEELEELLLESILQHLLAVKPPLGDNGCDMPGWKWSETRHFSIRSAYAMGVEQSVASFDSISSCISKFKGFPKIKMFFWLFAKGRIMKDLERVHWHIVAIIGVVFVRLTQNPWITFFDGACRHDFFIRPIYIIFGFVI